MSTTTNPQDLLSQLRQQQFYLVEMVMISPVENPLPVLGPHLDEHLAWLIERENNGTIFLCSYSAGLVGVS